MESPSGVSKELKPLQQQEELSRIVSESTSAILDVEDAGHAALTRTRIPRHRPRYSFKKRTGLGHHEPPSAAKQLKWKPPKMVPKVANNPSTTSVAKKDTDKKAKAIPKERSTNSSKTVKQKYLKPLSWHHPTSSLEVGLLEPNTKRVFTDRPDLQQAVVDCIRNASTKAVDVKRQAQRLIGGFIETLKTRIENEVAEARDDVSEGETLSETKRLEIRRKAVTDDERVILEYLGGKVKPKEGGDGENSTDGSQQHSDDTDLDEKGDKQVHFLQSFLVYLYSNNLPNKNSEIGKAVDGFVAMLVKFGLFVVTRSRGEINQRTPFTPTHLVRSVVGNLAWELKNMYQGGSHLLHDKVRLQVPSINMHVGLLQRESRSDGFNFFFKNIGQRPQGQGAVGTRYRILHSGGCIGCRKLPCPERAYTKPVANCPNYLVSASVCIILGVGAGSFFLEIGSFEEQVDRAGQFG